MRRSETVEVEAERLRARLSTVGTRIDTELIASVLRAQRAERLERSLRGKDRAKQSRLATSPVQMPPPFDTHPEPNPSTIEEERVVVLIATDAPDSDIARLGGVSLGFVTMVRKKYPQHIAAMIAQRDAAEREDGKGAL